jgi:hypothetical protein
MAKLIRTVPNAYSEYVIDEVVDFDGNTAKYKAISEALPAGSVVLTAGGTILEDLVEAGTADSFGIGPQGSDPDKYGKPSTAGLTAGTTFNLPLVDSVLSSAETIHVCGIVDSTGALGSANVTGGSVRVVITYRVTETIPDEL